MNIGKAIKDARIEKGYTQRELASLLGVSESTIQKYEVGKNQVPSGVIIELGKLLGISPLLLLDFNLENEEDIEYIKNNFNLSQLDQFSKVIVSGNLFSQKGRCTVMYELDNQLKITELADIHSLVDIILEQTDLPDEVSTDFLHKRRERALLNSLISYLWLEFSTEEQSVLNILKLLKMADCYYSDDYEYGDKTPLDHLIEDLRDRDAHSFAVEQYDIFKMGTLKQYRDVIFSVTSRLSSIKILIDGVEVHKHQKTVPYRNLRRIEIIEQEQKMRAKEKDTKKNKK